MDIYNILIMLNKLDNYNKIKNKIKIILCMTISQEKKMEYLLNKKDNMNQIKIQLIIYKMIFNYLINFKVCIMIIINHQYINNYYIV